MSNYVSWLITILYTDQLIKCALKVPRDILPGDYEEAPLESENKAFIHSLLPEHVKSCGSIVAIEEIFEVENIL